MKTVQISILARVYGNVNADETIGNRVTIKKFYSSEGEVLPFVSARAIKYSIRQALKERGFEIDPFVAEKKEMRDSGNPIKYVDNDLFGFMAPYKGKKKGEGGSVNRQAPIAISYFKALKNTPINVEFGARFPRENTIKIDKEKTEESNQESDQTLNPIPFEVEVADFIGRLNVLIYENVGKFTEEELTNVQDKNILQNILQKEGKLYVLPEEERKKRLKAFLEILLIPSYVLPRRTNSLNIPEYKVALIVLNKEGVLPIYQYLDYVKEGVVNLEKLKRLKEIVEEAGSEAYIIDYDGWVEEEIFPKITVKQAVEKILNHLL